LSSFETGFVYKSERDSAQERWIEGVGKEKASMFCADTDRHHQCIWTNFSQITLEDTTRETSSDILELHQSNFMRYTSNFAYDKTQETVFNTLLEMELNTAKKHKQRQVLP